MTTEEYYQHNGYEEYKPKNKKLFFHTICLHNSQYFSNNTMFGNHYFLFIFITFILVCYDS